MGRNEHNLFEGILLLSDLDGTLLNTKKEIPLRNLDAIRDFTRRGGLFTVATGRCPLSARSIALAAGINCPAVTLNGAVVYDYDKDCMAASKTLPFGYKELVRRVHEAFPHIGIQMYMGSDIFVAASNDVVERLFVIEKLPRRETNVDALPDRANKVLFGGENAQLQEVRAFLAGVEMTGMYGLFTESCYYEILPAHTNKGEGARAVAECCDILPAHVTAVGDYYNDVDMLKSVAYPMAAGNAPDDVKMFARFVTGDCDHGVIADAIEHLAQLLTRHGRT